MLKLSKTIFIITGLALVFFSQAKCLLSFAEENSAIIGLEITGNKLMIFTDFEPVSCQAVQIANTECDISYYGNISEAGINAETLILIGATASIDSEQQEAIYNLLSDLIENKPENDSFSIMEFNSELNLISDFTRDRFELYKSIENINFDNSSSRMYYSLDAAVDIMTARQTETFKRIVLISDGREQSRDGITHAAFTKKLEENAIPVYTIAVPSEESNLRRLAEFSRITNALFCEIRSYAVVATAINDYSGYGIVVARIPDVLMSGRLEHLKLTAGTSNGVIDIYRDIRLPMGDAIKPNDNINTVEEPPAIQTNSTIPVPAVSSSENNSNNMIFYIVIAVLVIVIAVSIVMIILLIRRKNMSPKVSKRKNNYDAPPKPDDSPHEEEPSDNGQESVFKLTAVNDPAIDFQSTIGRGIVIGRREESCMIAVPADKSISQEHCRIFKEGDSIYVEDLNSANGTHVNGKKIVDKTMIKHNDTLTLGGRDLKFEIIDAPGETRILFPEIVFKLTAIDNPAITFQSAVGEGVVIGRSSKNCIIVLYGVKSVSKEHCRIFKESGLIYVKDLDSSNGTYVNGKKIESQTILKTGDTLTLGKLALKFEVLETFDKGTEIL